MDAFQGHYPDNAAHCGGAGSRREHGHRTR